MKGIMSAVVQYLSLRNKAVIIAVAVLLFLAIYCAGDYFYFKNRVHLGIFVEDCYVGGEKTGKALDTLYSRFTGIEDKEIRLIIPPDDESISTSFFETGFSADWEATLSKAYSLGRSSWFGANLFERSRMIFRKARINLEFSVDEQKLDLFLTDLAQKCDIPPRDAAFIIDGDRVVISDSAEGFSLDMDGTRKILEETWRLNAGTFQDTRKVETKAAISIREPGITGAELEKMGVEEIISSFSTIIAPNGYSRFHNIKLATSHLHYFLLAPEEVFSFNEVVGQITREAGYLDAPIILRGKLVDGVGGGVCQVSTTLYNAVLLANLPIVERHHHSMPVAYVPLGRDATISYDYLDLKFKNNRPHYILFGMEITGSNLRISLFGQSLEKEISIIHTNLEEVPPPVVYEEDPELEKESVELFQKGSSGYRVTTWRVVYQDGKEIDREKLSSDYYRPRPYIYRTGASR